ncbi:MAG: IS3 family transposase [Candidatus Synoicihabitans palmerolidicus]|nr:IS3 family transposase [Candidatus Synoicihabitans palmerolidicus]
MPVSQWKKGVSERLPEVFAKPSAQVRDEIERNRKEKELYARIGQLQMELAWLKKKLAHLESKERRSMIETEHPKLSVARPCELLELPRSTYYHHPKPPKEADLALMKQIDEIYLESPFFGSRQMTRWLQREGHVVNRKRVRRLMRLMGLTAIYQKPSLSKKAASHQIYPYLLRTRKVERSNQVWVTDIIYIPVCGDRLALADGARMGTVQHARCVVLRASGAARDGDLRQAGDLQHRPRLPVYQRRVHPAIVSRRRATVDGRQRTVLGQCLGRTPVAQRQIRGSLSETL